MKRIKQTNNQVSFASYYQEQRSARISVFYNQINTIIDWAKFDQVISRFYRKGGNPSGIYPSGILLFKMFLLGIWNGLSDVKTEGYVNDSLSAMRFCGLDIEDTVPDHSHFRTELTNSKGMDKILAAFNKQLEKHEVIVQTGIKVDATLPQSPASPKVIYWLSDCRRP